MTPARWAARRAALALGLLLVGSIATGLVLWPKGTFGPLADVAPPKHTLTGTEDGWVYGYGEHLGVTMPAPAEARFDFEVADTAPSVRSLRFESLGIEKREEVELVLNGVRIGSVTPGMGDYTKEQRVKLPKKYLKSGIPNELIFGHTVNQRDAKPQEYWAISKVALLVRPLPSCEPAECLKEARRLYESAERLWANVCCGNCKWEAWLVLNKALLHLEKAEPELDPDLADRIQQFLRDADRTIDSSCSKTLLGARKYEETHQLDLALKEYRNGLQWFPTDDHPCRA
ncbi:MAG: hypothetical protein HY901_14780, partial [Deltaproteobacteria bacterium]|nr:hypothetical protein [Deltaproteobacteria bacterium]